MVVLVLREVGDAVPAVLCFMAVDISLSGVLQSSMALCQPSVPKRTVLFPAFDSTRFIV